MASFAFSILMGATGSQLSRPTNLEPTYTASLSLDNWGHLRYTRQVKTLEKRIVTGGAQSDALIDAGKPQKASVYVIGAMAAFWITQRSRSYVISDFYCVALAGTCCGIVLPPSQAFVSCVIKKQKHSCKHRLDCGLQRNAMLADSSIMQCLSC